MKKIIILLLIMGSLFLFFKNADKNIIKEANILKSQNEIILNLKSDYKTDINLVKENSESVYFDIKNAFLKEDYKVTGEGDLSVLSQQIGDKVRIYLKGNNLSAPIVQIEALKQNAPFDYAFFAIISFLTAFLLILAQKSYSATIKLRENTVSVKTPMQTAMNLNRSLYDKDRRKPEIVLNKYYTNPVKTEIYDFEFAKNRKNTKIAI